MGSELPAGSRWGARLLVLAACPAFAALGFYLAGNGLTRAGAALASLPIGCLSGAAILHRKKRHLAGVILGLTVLLALAYIHQRLQQTEPQKAALTFCEQGRCGGAPPLLTRLATEGETAMAGMALTSFFRMIEEPEKSELTRLLRISYSEQEQNPPWNALPNTPLMSLLDREGRYQLWMPTGAAKPPCIVFLHGFGGQLTAYLHALIEGGLGADFAIVAPLGGPSGTGGARTNDSACFASSITSHPASTRPGSRWSASPTEPLVQQSWQKTDDFMGNFTAWLPSPEAARSRAARSPHRSCFSQETRTRGSRSRGSRRRTNTCSRKEPRAPSSASRGITSSS